MRLRYEPFGGIIALDDPPATVYVDHAYMRGLGHTNSPLWRGPNTYLSAPVTAHFAVTHRCPMGCQTCYNSSGQASTDELTTADAKRVLDVLAHMQVFTVAFGGGEPLARPDIFELASYARDLGITPTMTTNGYHVNRLIARRCRVFSHIHVSIDGVGATYEAVRGVDGHHHAIRALKLLRRARVPVGVNCVVCRSNFDHLEELARSVAGSGVRDVIFLRLKPRGRARPLYESERLTPAQRVELYQRLVDLTRRYRLRSHVDCAMMPFVFWHRPDQEALNLFAAEGCVAGNEIVEIDPNGSVRACSFEADAVGSAVDLPALWDRADRFRRFRGWADTAPDPCASCEYLDLCHGGCHALAEALTGDFNAPDPGCLYVSAGSER